MPKNVSDIIHSQQLTVNNDNNSDIIDQNDQNDTNREELKSQKKLESEIQKKEFKHDNKIQKANVKYDENIINKLDEINKTLEDVITAIYVSGGSSSLLPDNFGGRSEKSKKGKPQKGKGSIKPGSKRGMFTRGAKSLIHSDMAKSLVTKAGSLLTVGVGAYDYATANNDNERIDAVSTTGGVLAGASAGAAIGSVVPVVGTFIGGVIGGIVGGYGGSLLGDQFKNPEDIIPDEITAKGAPAEISYIDNIIIPEIEKSLATNDGKYSKKDLAEINKYKNSLLKKAKPEFEDMLSKAGLSNKDEKTKLNFILDNIAPLKNTDTVAYKTFAQAAVDIYHGDVVSGNKKGNGFVAVNNPIKNISKTLSTQYDKTKQEYSTNNTNNTNNTSSASNPDNTYIPHDIDVKLDSYIGSGIDKPALLSTVVPEATPDMINKKLGININKNSIMKPSAPKFDVNIKRDENQSGGTTIINNNVQPGGGSIQTTDPKTNRVTNAGVNLLSYMM